MLMSALLIAAGALFCVFLVVALMRLLRAPAAATAELPHETVKPAVNADTAVDDRIAPDILARIEKEVAARLGPGARVLSVKRLETPYSRANSWAHQGRVFAHGSHKTGDRPR